MLQYTSKSNLEHPKLLVRIRKGWLTLTAPTSPNILAKAARPLYVSDQNAHVWSSPDNAKERESSRCVESVSAGSMVARNLWNSQKKKLLHFHVCASKYEDAVVHIPEIRGNAPGLCLLS